MAHHPASSTQAAATPGSSGARKLPADDGAAVHKLIPLGLPVYCAGSTKRYAALTFDDGPGPYTRLALRILHRAHIPATFFLVGRNVRWFPLSAHAEAQREVLGNHSYTHPPLAALPHSQVLSQLVETSALIQQQLGRAVDLFRPPYMSRNAYVDATAKKLGMLEILWNVDSGDSQGANYAQITHRVLSGLGNGAIVLMHENRGQTIRALKFSIVPALRKRHIHLVTVPELLAKDPPSAAQLRAGRAGCHYTAIGAHGS